MRSRARPDYIEFRCPGQWWSAGAAPGRRARDSVPGRRPTSGGPVMTEPFASLSDAQLLAELSREIDTLCLLPSPDQRRLLAMARGLDSEGMGRPFVIAGVRSSAAVLADLADTDRDSVLARPEVRRFIEENAVSGERG